MLIGKTFTLGKSTLSLAVMNGRRTAISIPVGATVSVVSEPNNGDGIVDVLWEGRTIAMFLVDLQSRGTEIRTDSAKA